MMNTNVWFKTISRLALVAALAWIPDWASAAQVGKTKESAGKTVSINDDKAVWQLAGREGECTPLALLEKKGAQYKDVKYPNQLAEILRAAGHKAEVKEFRAGSRPAVEVRAPEAGIHVMFVRQQDCGKLPPAEKK